MDKSLRKYREYYRDPIDLDLQNLEIHDYAVVIPLYSEDESFLERLTHFSRIEAELLLILVVNEAPDSPQEAKLRNQNLLQALDSKRNFFETHSIMIVDRTQAKAIEGGVGEARKIGFDLALELFCLGKLKQAWVLSTDADVWVPKNYLEPLSRLPSHAAAYHYAFRHHSKDPQLDFHTYENFLEDYVLGLAWANSPYAYPSVGSCLAIELHRYAQVRGFPKRKAGEDFYLLNKLRKLGSIISDPQPQIVIEARHEIRTPFGTSAALQKIKDEPNIFYDFETYQKLSDFLKTAQSFLHSKDFCEKSFEILSNLWPTGLNRDELKKSLLGIFDRCSDSRQRLYQFHIWFDAFRTLRFIHSWTQEKYPKGPKPAFLDKPAYKANWRALSGRPILDYIDWSGHQNEHGSSIGKTRVHA